MPKKDLFTCFHTRFSILPVALLKVKMVSFYIFLGKNGIHLTQGKTLVFQW